MNLRIFLYFNYYCIYKPYPYYNYYPCVFNSTSGVLLGNDVLAYDYF
jgi:hypothetical protein